MSMQNLAPPQADKNDSKRKMTQNILEDEKDKKVAYNFLEDDDDFEEFEARSADEEMQDDQDNKLW